MASLSIRKPFTPPVTYLGVIHARRWIETCRLLEVKKARKPHGLKNTVFY